MICSNCGNQIPAEGKFCEECGTVVPAPAEDIFVEPGPARDGTETVAAGAPPIPPPPLGVPPLSAPPLSAPRAMPMPPGPAGSGGRRQFALAQDERILKTYNAVYLRTGLLRRRRGQGTLYVTDARVVFCAWVYPRGVQRESWFFQQTKLEDISGVFAFVSRRVSLAILFLSFLMIIGLLGAIVARSAFGVIMFLIFTGLCVMWLLWDSARRGTVGVVINSRENDSSPIAFGHGPKISFSDRIVRVLLLPIRFFIPSYNAFDVADGDPAEDADALLRELGALILDLQTRGRLAYDRWEIESGDGVAGRGSAAAGAGG